MLTHTDCLTDGNGSGKENGSNTAVHEAVKNGGDGATKAVGSNNTEGQAAETMRVQNDMDAEWVKEHIARYGKEPNLFDGA